MNVAVVDASIFGPMLFTDEWNDKITPIMDMLQSCELHVPAHWTLELGNMLLVGHRRGRISDRELAGSIEGLLLMGVRIDDTGDRAWDEVFALAVRHGLTLYDAAYLELSIRRDAWLASDDRLLIAAAESEGVTVRTSLQ